MGSHQAERGTGASRDGRRGGELSGPAKLNEEIIASRSAGEILAIVEDRGESFSKVNVATAVNKLSKVAKARDDLRRDPRYRRLLELVRLHCSAFRGRQVANVVHGLGVLCANKGAGNIDKETAELLMRAVQKNADETNPQEIANVLNALSKLDAAASAVSPEGWKRLAEAAEREAQEMNPQENANVLNALSKLDAAAAVVSPEGWKRLAEAAEREAKEMNPQAIANVLNALSKLDAAAAAVSREGWKRLAEAAEWQAREMNPQAIANVLNALSKLDAAASAVTREGWSHFSVAVERQSVAMNAQAVSNTLNAYAEMRKRRPQASAAVAETGWHSLAAATARTAPTMTNQVIALTVDAAKKLDAFASAIDDEGWEILAAAVARMALDFNEHDAVLALSAVGWKQELARSLHRQGGFDALIGSIERNIDAIRRGYPPDFAKETQKTLHAIRLIYEHDDGAYGDERLEGLRTELQTKPGNRHK